MTLQKRPEQQWCKLYMARETTGWGGGGGELGYLNCRVYLILRRVFDLKLENVLSFTK